MARELDGKTTGERIRILRERLGLSRPVLAGLVGRGPEWLKKIETGERELRNIRLLVALGQALKVADLAVLTGNTMPLPMNVWERLGHPAVEPIRAAMTQAPLQPAWSQVVPPSPDNLRARVGDAWRRWHTSPFNRTEIGAQLPGLIREGHACVKVHDGERRRDAWETMSELYRLVQRLLAHIGSSELYWMALDRQRIAAEQADRPLSLAAAVWSSAQGLRSVGYVDEAVQADASAMAMLEPMLEAAQPDVLSAYGRLALQASIASGLDGRAGDAWRYLGKAEQAARRLPEGHWDSQCSFCMANVEVHAASIGVGLHRPAEVITRAERLDTAGIPSIERRSRLLLEIAFAYAQRKDPVAALTMLQTAFELTPENTRYVPQARALAADLTRRVGGPLSHRAVQLAEDMGAIPTGS
jgi:transcriptional regulator with XRE-family HTH domain